MQYLFSKTGIAALKTASKQKTLFAFDFDGTLARITKNIEGATMTTVTSMLLGALSKQAPVAVVSGRSIQDLQNRILSPTTYLVGNHGLEGLDKWRKQRTIAKATCRSWEKQLSSQKFENGVLFEGKTYSLSLHYRGVKNKKLAAKRLNEIISSLNPTPRIIGGKSVFNLIPQNSPHKGTALQELKIQNRVQRLIYVGDDDTDEDVFTTNIPFLIGIRVGKKISSNAQFYLKRQSEINSLLKLLLKNLAGS